MGGGGEDEAELAEAAATLGGELAEETDGETDGEATLRGKLEEETDGELAAETDEEADRETDGDATLRGEMEEKTDREAPSWAGLHACRCQPDQGDKQPPTWSSLHAPWRKIRQGAPGKSWQARFKEQTNRICEANCCPTNKQDASYRSGPNCSTNHELIKTI